MSLPESIEKYQPRISRMGSVGEGWFPIVEELHNALVRIDPDYHIEQIKEKFGGLRYYYFSEAQLYGAMDPLVTFAERLAARTCQDCSAPGSVRQLNGWIVTLCDACESRKAAERSR